MKLNQIRDNVGATKARKRVGRGIGSGLGKTAGRGGKGQTARAGGAKPGFEGGQMPIYRRLPKRGFNKPNKVAYNEVTLDRVQKAIDAKKLDTGHPVTLAALAEAGVVSQSYAGGIRLIAKGEFKAKADFEVYHASKGAVAAVEKAGGSVKMLKPVEPEKPATEAPKEAKEKPAKSEKPAAKAPKS
jgi:large subunit ribosomal protein L15